MSVNTAHANGGVLIHTGETILLFSDNVTMDFSGQDGALFRGSKQGRIYLTTHRVIFNSKNSKEPMQSFSSPFISMSDVELEQPVFGANYLKGKIRAQQNGNFTGEVKFKLAFKSGGCTDFGSALLRAASMAKKNSNGMAPPPYEPPGGNWYAAPPPAYTAQPGAYGWLPNNSAFTSPQGGVFMSDAPPPYPGINAPFYQAPPNVQQPQYGFSGPYPGAASNNPPPYASGNPYPGAAQNGETQQFGNSAPYPGAPQNGPPQYGGAAPGAPQQFGNSAPYPGAASGSTYPSLPSQAFGFNAPSAPMSKEQEAAASAFYDPRNPNAAFVHNPQNFNMPPSYDSLNQSDPNNKKTQ